MSTAKQQVESLLHKLPENCSLEDIQYHLYVLDKVRHGLEVAKQQGTISQDDVEKRLSLRNLTTKASGSGSFIAIALSTMSNRIELQLRP